MTLASLYAGNRPRPVQLPRCLHCERRAQDLLVTNRGRLCLGCVSDLRAAGVEVKVG